MKTKHLILSFQLSYPENTTQGPHFGSFYDLHISSCLSFLDPCMHIPVKQPFNDSMSSAKINKIQNRILKDLHITYIYMTSPWHHMKRHDITMNMDKLHALFYLITKWFSGPYWEIQRLICQVQSRACLWVEFANESKDLCLLSLVF